MLKTGLFPIKNILFPGSILPVHVFEQRYVKLIKDVILDDASFGINYKDSGKIYNIGCLAKVFKIINDYNDGRMDILIQGVVRYKVLDKKISDMGYFIAEIEIINDIKNGFNSKLVEQCLSLFNNMVRLVNQAGIQTIDQNNFQYANPSFYIAQKAGLSNDQKYHLLGILNEDDRLRFMLRHLKSIFPIVKEAEIVSRLVLNDGYYQPAYYSGRDNENNL